MSCCELGVGWVGGLCFVGLSRNVSNLGEEGGDDRLFLEWVGGWVGRRVGYVCTPRGRGERGGSNEVL